ncbi:MAG TPA: c-type cytochrome [Terriglobales bacterium]|nr:c-type cytochrome [Terriglobales bacterium]
MKAILKAFALLVALMAVLGVLSFIWIGSRGISAKAQPGTVETVVARTMRRLAIPRSARDLKNPVTKKPDVLAEGMAHYSDHCAACHANDGSGETEVGLGLYPKPPDMRLDATQSMTDGELFYIIENGVRLTGMPAWSTGTDDGKEATWHLVHFIRELPRLTPEQIEQMKAMNPRSPDEIRQELEEQKFLQGGSETPKPRPPTHKH